MAHSDDLVIYNHSLLFFLLFPLCKPFLTLASSCFIHSRQPARSHGKGGVWVQIGGAEHLRQVHSSGASDSTAWSQMRHPWWDELAASRQDKVPTSKFSNVTRGEGQWGWHRLVNMCRWTKLDRQKKPTRKTRTKHISLLQALSCWPWPVINVTLEHIHICP